MKERKEEKYENVCINCSNLFITSNEEMTLCPKCWNIYLQNQLRTQTYIRLTEDYINKLLSKNSD